jgi:hypothetical protein
VRLYEDGKDIRSLAESLVSCLTDSPISLGWPKPGVP